MADPLRFLPETPPAGLTRPRSEVGEDPRSRSLLTLAKTISLRCR
jgi:hypothetical protein